MRWIPGEDGSVGTLHLGQQKFRWDPQERLFEPWYFIPVQVDSKDDGGRPGASYQSPVAKKTERMVRAGDPGVASQPSGARPAKHVQWAEPLATVTERVDPIVESVPAITVGGESQIPEDGEAPPGLTEDSDDESEAVGTDTGWEGGDAQDQVGSRAASRGDGIWHNFTVDDAPTREESTDLPKLDVPPITLSAEERKKVIETLLERAGTIPGGKELVEEFADLFENTLQRPGMASVQHRIDTGSASPFVDPQRKYSLGKRKFLLEVRKDWQSRGIIEPSESEWAANPHCAKDDGKPGGYRPCGDYRGLNRRTIADVYPPDSLDRIYERVMRSDITTTMDGVDGYFAIPIAQEDRPKTAIRLPLTEESWGLFQLKVALFGLRNAGSTYDRWMNSIVNKFGKPDTVASLRDDLYVTTVRQPGESDSALLARHLAEVRSFWELLRREGVKLKPKKLRLAVLPSEPLEILGYVIHEHRMGKRPEDTEAIRSFPEPQTMAQLRRFLGLVGWMRRFVPNLSRTEGALVNAGAMPQAIRSENAIRREQGRPLRNDWKIQLDEQAKESFKATKIAIENSMLLSPFSEDDSEWETCLNPDASGGAVGGVLLQRHRTKPGVNKVVACASRKMTPAELNYPPTEQELLAVYFCIKVWEHWCEGRCIVVWSDHQPLEPMNRQVTPHTRGRITRWFLFLQDFRLKIEHVPGSKNQFADALSRMFQEPSVQDPDERTRIDPAAVARVLVGREPSPEDIERMAEQKVLDIVEAQRSCPEVIAIRFWMARGELPEAWVKENGANGGRLKEVIGGRAGKFVEKDEVLYTSGDSGRTRLVVPVRLRRMLVKQHHDAATGGHRGVEKTLQRLRMNYWWPRMREDIEAYIRSCRECARAKQPWPIVGDLQPLDVYKVFEYLHVDLIGPLPRTLSGNEFILNCVDRGTKRTVLYALPNKESRTVARALVKNVCWHGSAPASIQSDQGTEFVNGVVKDMTHLLGINHVKGAAYHPQTNGQAERMNPQIESMLAIFGDLEQRTWDMNLDFVMYALNASESEVTGETPHFLSWGRRPLDPLDILFRVDPDPAMSREHWLDRLKKARELAAQANEAANQRMKERADKGKEPHDLEVGDTVWVKEKRTPPGLSPKLRPKAADVQYQVKGLMGGGRKHALVESLSNPLDQRKVHVDRLKEVVKEPEGIFGEPSTVVPPLGPDEYEVECILAHRPAISGEGVEYYVRWKGYGASEDKWVHEKDVSADECVARYVREQQARQERVIDTPLTYVEVAKKAAVKRRGSPSGINKAEEKVTLVPKLAEKNVAPVRKSTRPKAIPKGPPRSR